MSNVIRFSYCLCAKGSLQRRYGSLSCGWRTCTNVNGAGGRRRLNNSTFMLAGIRCCTTTAKPLLLRQQRNQPKIAATDLRRKYFKNLISTLQMKQKSLECNELTACSPQKSQYKELDCMLPVSDNDSMLHLHPGTEQMWATSVRSLARKCDGLPLKSQTVEHAKDISVKQQQHNTHFPKNYSGSKKAAKRKPHVEHREDSATHFSRKNVADFQEYLSRDELVILSQLARALSLPDDVRQSLQVYLNCRRQGLEKTVEPAEVAQDTASDIDFPNDSIAVDDAAYQAYQVQDAVLHSAEQASVQTDMTASENDFEDTDFLINHPVHEQKKVKSKKPVKLEKPKISLKDEAAVITQKSYWSIEDLQYGDQLKELLSRTSKILLPDKKLLMEKAASHQKQLKDNIYHMKMATFVELCINTGMQKQAQSVLTSCYLRGRHRSKNYSRGMRAVCNLDIYNRLMHCWAKQGNMEAIQKLFIQIEGLDMQPNFRSYAICLECLGRHVALSHNSIKKILRDIDRHNFRLEAIFNECQLTDEEEGFILKAIKAVRPEFVPDSRQHNRDYVCPLLTSLNGPHEPTSNPFVGIMSADKLSNQITRQMKIETSDRVVVESVVPQPKITTRILAARERLENEKTKWRDALKHSFLTNRQHLYAYGETGTSVLPYLKLWKPDVYVDLMMQQVDILGQDMDVYSPSCSLLHLILGNKIFNKYCVQIRSQNNYMDKVLHLYKEYLKLFGCSSLSGNHRQLWTDLMADMKLQNFMYTDGETRPSSVTKAIGKFLFDIIMSEVKVQIPTHSKKKTPPETDKIVQKDKCDMGTEIPAFFTVYRMRNGIMNEEVMPHPFLVRLYDDAELTELTFEPNDMPSLVPPVPWFAHSGSGNLLGTTDLIRNPSLTSRQRQIVKRLPPQTLFPMFDGLNMVSSCPWTVNKPILDLIIEVFNKGGDSKLDIPESVDRSLNLPRPLPDMSAEERFAVLRQNRKILKERKDEYSQWCTELYRLSVANKYRDEIFWFPHNMDFRGRIYPTPAHFNHFGSDMARSILVFGKAKPLGPCGLDWLKIHLVNLTGFRKRHPNCERLEFANSVMSEILDSADKPFTGRRWWQTSDEPWQTLACCMEVANAVRSPNPKEFLSRIPVHQDGSCNVLQHYAALGRDVVGAQSVNLNPFDAPKDVYSDVLELVEKKRKEDAANGVEIAKSLEGFLQRKVIKQTIMTSVYGVTKYGARSQIDNQLRHNVDNFPPELVFAARAYLAEKTFESLHVMFTTNKAIQDWLVTCAEIISRIRQQPVEWVTPLGWPVQQPYFKVNRVEDKKVSVVLEKPNTVKQKNAIPPNFIHSLDSAHMMLTAIHCLRAGIMFASIHDCFWTHACDIPAMNKICREQFVALHSQPILANVASALHEQYGFTSAEISSENSEERKEAKELVNFLLQRVPRQGTFDITKVLESTYFFS